ASALRAQVASATTQTDVETFQQAHAAISLARAASAVIVGELSNFGLPSQQARTSRVVAAVHGTITEIGDQVSSSADTTVPETIALAQQLYRAAYEAYSAGTYAKAGALARAAVSAAQATALAAGLYSGKFGRHERWFGREDGHAGPEFGKGGRRGGARACRSFLASPVVRAKTTLARHPSRFRPPPWGAPSVSARSGVAQPAAPPGVPLAGERRCSDGSILL
ncbi:MAG: hypothetical protein C4346_09545, partial [Chloroflexota bacterium]